MQDYTISAIIPTYNHGTKLSIAIDSFLNQSTPPHEILVINDASTDNTTEILARYINNPIIKVYTNEKNLGAVESLNRGLSLATSKYVTFRAADDYSKKDFIKNSIQGLQRYPFAKICCSIPMFEEENGRLYGADFFCPSIKDTSFLSPEALRQLCTKPDFFWVAGHTTVISKNLCLELGGFSKDLCWHCDWFLFHVAAFKSGIVYIPEQLAILTVSKDSYSHSSRLNPKKRAEQNQVILNLVDKIKLLPSDIFQNLEDVEFFEYHFPNYGAAIVSLIKGNNSNYNYLDLYYELNSTKKELEKIEIQLKSCRLSHPTIASLLLRVFRHIKNSIKRYI